ncbi:MAG: hypothetical protein D3923_17075 [Candidatus Electrothrix sp. AR3]|nr:hypothetical protein [Candidatus Electrothrix sp. AR3]
MEPEISIERIRKGRGEELNDFEQLDQLRQVADRFAGFDDSCICRLDASQGLEHLQKEIGKIVLERFGGNCKASK